jgi:hypothetical protein
LENLARSHGLRIVAYGRGAQWVTELDSLVVSAKVAESGSESGRNSSAGQNEHGGPGSG